MYTQRVSVRNLVEFVHRSGSLDLRFQGKTRMVDGIKIHQKIQKSQGEDYLPEVSLQRIHIFERAGEEPLSLLVSGRADGILELPDGYVIDEIKGISRDLEDVDEWTYPLHWAQAKCYGYMFALAQSLDEIDVQITYANLDSQEIKRIKRRFTFEALEHFYLDTVNQFEKWLRLRYEWLKRRNASIEMMTFPFPDYRKGQREMALAVYQAIKREKSTFIEAPTGIGKTISTLFPAIKSLQEGLADKIFYLSAKAVTKTVAEEAVAKLYNRGLEIRQMTLTAKDKICFLDQATCYPEKCPYADGHYDRVNDALWEMLNAEMHYTRQSIELISESHRICPYEFSLDLALYADIVVCDYNYAFDPRVYLRRFFDVPSEAYVFLVDEAHNLVDRARTMYSAELNKAKVMQVKKMVGDRDRLIKKELEAVNRIILDARGRCDEEGVYVDNHEIAEVYTQLRRRASNMEKWLASAHQFEGYDQVLDLYFDILSYLRISELYDEGFLFYIIRGHHNDTTLKLFCINPRTQLARFINNSRATVFFSATLTPIDYYKHLLITDEDPLCYRLPSPFDPERRLVMAARDVNVTYKEREHAKTRIADYIHALVQARVGNYLVFFPSYHYMSSVFDAFDAQYGSMYDIIIQDRQMDESQRFSYLKSFEDASEARREGRELPSLLGFAVLGGIFSEGIDLKGDLLIGTVIVGVGMPMISFENDLIKAYFEQDGFAYAYRYPGINKVMQGAGRVIRDASDKGVILLLDARFLQRQYTATLSAHWTQQPVDIEEMQAVIKSFWREESTP